MKDHEIRELVNKLTEIARTYAHTHQLRAHISREVNRALKTNQPEKALKNEPVNC